MAITLANYYEQYANGNTTGLYSQPGGITIPNPNDPNNNNASKYQTPGGTLTNDPSPLITFPVTKRGGINELAGSGFSALESGGAGTFALQTADSLLGRLTENLAAGAVDTARISKFFYTTPQGIAFNLKQVGLQRMNTKVPHGGPWGDNLPITKLLNDPQIYNLGINLLTQIPLEAIDIHIERHGAFPHFKEYPNNKGVYSQWFQSNENNVDSSLVSLYSLLDSPPVNGLSNAPIIEWFEYNGGPKSILGIGNTSHRRWTVSDNDPSGSTGVQPNPLPDLNPTSTNLPTINIISATALSSGLPRTLKSLDTENLSLFKNASIGRVSKRTSNERKDLRKPSGDAIDKINYVGLLKGSKSDSLGKVVNDLVDKNGFKNKPEDLPKDLIKFRFEAIDNDNVDNSIFVFFRAFLNNITDRYSPTWNPNQYVGRGEKFFIYDGFARDISFNFSIAAQTRAEVKPLIQKLNFLASNTSPDYNAAGRMRGSFMRLTIGDYFVSLPGFISSLTYTLRDDSPWDIALYKDLDDEFGKNERELPHMIDVSVSYTPIHDFLPKKGTNDVFYMLGKGDEWITELPKMNEDWIKRDNGQDIINEIDSDPEIEFNPLLPTEDVNFDNIT
jgi:hypothetical protein